MTLFVVLQDVVLTYGSVDKLQTCDHLSESYQAVLPVVLFTTLHKVVIAFEFSDENLKCVYSNEMCQEHYFVVLLFLSRCTRWH